MEDLTAFSRAFREIL